MAGDELTRFILRQLILVLRWISVVPSALFGWALPVVVYAALTVLLLSLFSSTALSTVFPVPIALLGIAATTVGSVVAAALATAASIQAGASSAPASRTNVAVVIALMAGATFVWLLPLPHLCTMLWDFLRIHQPVASHAFVDPRPFIDSPLGWLMQVGSIAGCLLGASAGLRDFLTPVPPPADIERLETTRWPA